MAKITFSWNSLHLKIDQWAIACKNLAVCSLKSVNIYLISNFNFCPWLACRLNIVCTLLMLEFVKCIFSKIQRGVKPTVSYISHALFKLLPFTFGMGSWMTYSTIVTYFGGVQHGFAFVKILRKDFYNILKSLEPTKTNVWRLFFVFLYFVPFQSDPSLIIVYPCHLSLNN